MKKLEWNVLLEDINARQIKMYNIFDHGSFLADLKKFIKKYNEKSEFELELKKSLMYYFWSRCEYEIVATSWPPYIYVTNVEKLKEELDKLPEDAKKPRVINVEPIIAKKLDVYQQIIMNWEHFFNYVWTNTRSKNKDIQ